MANRIVSLNKKFAYSLLILLLLGFFIVFRSLISGQSSSKVTNNSDLLDLPVGWSIEINDDTGCYSIYLHNYGFYSGSIEEYLRDSLSTSNLEGLKEINRRYDIQSAQVFIMSQSGVGNINTFYIKSGNGKVYSIELDDLLLERRKASVFCNDPSPIINHIISSLD